MRLVILGAGGRMGRSLIKAITEGHGALVHAAVERPGSPLIGTDAGTLAGTKAVGLPVTDGLDAALDKADGVIDFTTPAATALVAEKAAARGLVHVVGTTGLGEEDFAGLRAAAARAVIVQSGNMSLGVNLLAALVKRVAASLGEDFDIEVLEMHHRMKVDAPSGTALMLGEAAAQGRDVPLAQRAVKSREGHTGIRRVGDIGFATLRGGSVVGDHSVIFAGPSERITLSHHAEDRGLFANGAVKAALWARGRTPGFYTMADVLGLTDF